MMRAEIRVLRSSECIEEPAIVTSKEGEFSIRIDSPNLGVLYRRGTVASVEAWMDDRQIIVHPKFVALYNRVAMDLDAVPVIEELEGVMHGS